MKLFCPISGVPFYTLDKLPLQYTIEHPIFSIPFEGLMYALKDTEHQENKFIQDAPDGIANENASLAFIAQLANQARNDKAYREPAFQLYTAKKLLFLAFFKECGLLEVEEGCYCKINPRVLYANYAKAIELFIWAEGFTPRIAIAKLPRFKISKQTEQMDNLNDYLTLLQESRDDTHKLHSLTEERILDKLEQAIAILSINRNVQQQMPWEGRNRIVAKWALLQTGAPANIYDFWFAILSKQPETYHLAGINVNGERLPVSMNDLKELQGYMLENLITDTQDGSYYYDSMTLTFSIIEHAIQYFYQQDAQFKIIDPNTGREQIAASVKDIEAFAKSETGKVLPEPVPNMFATTIQYKVALAKWRIEMRKKMTELSAPAETETPKADINKGFDFL